MNYGEITQVLFREFCEPGTLTARKMQKSCGNETIAGVGRLRNTHILERKLWLVHKTTDNGNSDDPGRKSYSLEVVSPESFAREPWDVHESVGNEIHFFVRTCLDSKKHDDFRREKIWLNYSGWAGRSFDPAMEGASQILAVHRRLDELLCAATPIKLAKSKDMVPA